MPKLTKDEILKEFALFSLDTGGIGNWLTESTDEEVFHRLSTIDRQPLTKVQLNQLLSFAHEAIVSDDFFHYYWLSAPIHSYEVEKVTGFQESWVNAQAITSIEHLKWGLYRIYIDGLLYFGNVRTAFRNLRSMSNQQLSEFFREKRFDTERIKQRGPALQLTNISKDDRYLISEMACKSYGDTPESPGQLKVILLDALRIHQKHKGGRITFRGLIEGHHIKEKYSSMQLELGFSLSDVLEESIESENDFEQKYKRLADRFFKAREIALKNTKYYLSMVSDLDVYVATSMRNRQDFRDMATVCEKIFSDKRLSDLQLRYFNPTLSAATGHEDKGLIECLMVKCAKVLLYCAGEKETYGKDAEAAMALSLGKFVIFYCDQDQKHRFYRDVHPLSRLIDFSTGVAVGAFVTDSLKEVSELLYRIFENKMEYYIEQPKPGYLRLKDALTNSVVRLQTNNQLLAETFWNNYHGLKQF